MKPGMVILLDSRPAVPPLLVGYVAMALSGAAACFCYLWLAGWLISWGCGR